MLREDANKASKKKDKAARKPQQQQKTVDRPNKPPVSVSAEAVKPQRADAQSAPSQASPSRLRTLWPEAPPPGNFSR
jgi:hypothetical protein